MSGAPVTKADVDSLRLVLQGHSIPKPVRESLLERELISEWTVVNTSLTLAGSAAITAADKEDS